MSGNTKSNIPDGEGHDVREETSLTVPDLPGEWEWGSANHYHWNHKVNVFFGLKSKAPVGWYGEIDNYLYEGAERWTLHVRPIVADGTESGIPRETAETTEEHASLDEAIEATPDHIATHYETE